MKKIFKFITLFTILITSAFKAFPSKIKTNTTKFKYTNNGTQDFRAPNPNVKNV